ncbi:hypothetical protein EDF58_106263 [Novosphingobium sp. PhB57]|jgi:hypothetical protein|uniref:hypothetical protein n=1 Tax=unclassified Novosphingobium TaxID=2644732 RepID=UPI001053C48C|nr:MULTISPECIES: hypothetical protein [unclassified Novosphingobium]TCU55973.1 hypothetical protein EDF58_106263 [Novosphingobium sp. PhB57]TDW65111.1 hypothetical protein EDF57_103288 [Novosphingobium sp. PhB55]
MQDFTSPQPSPISRPRSRGGLFFVAFIAFLLGGALVVWAAQDGLLDKILPQRAADPAAPQPETQPTAAPVPALPAATAPASPEQLSSLSSVEGRLALIEDRISRIDFQTDAASGNAARAEGLLIAFAARRMVDRGEPLSYVADQLRLRFTNAQPRAVQTVIEFSKNPVTIDELSARLEALSPELSESQSDESLWQKARRELSSLFVVRRESSTLLTPTARIDRARLMLSARRIANAISEVERLPNAQAAQTWTADARRYQDVQDALNLLETTAMLEPRRLTDAEGQAVDQPSPLATPGVLPTDLPSADASEAVPSE